MRLFDSHAHLTSLKAGDVLPVLERAKEAGVALIINIATLPLELTSGLALASSAPYIFHAGSTTPHDVARWGERDFPFFSQHVEQLVAIGETGLDYHYEHSPAEIQHLFLRKYLHLASSSNLPVIFHCREAFEDLFRIVDEEKYTGKALLHCFTGTLEEAREVVKRGWSLSLSGIVTYKKSDALREVAREVPLSHLLIETDAPYLAPQSQRGKVNEPAFLLETAKCIANERSMDLEAFAEATFQNGLNFFDLKFSETT